VWIAHAGGLRSGGFHLRELAVKAGDAVRLGDAIGTVGDNPVDNDAAHLHWEVYQGPVTGYPRGTVDPERWLAGARVLPSGVIVR
jgi:murein DD-endopeptidase MepM/ murein hydrolase activator NlpD